MGNTREIKWYDMITEAHLDAYLLEEGLACPLCRLEFTHPGGAHRAHVQWNLHINHHFLAYFCRCGRGANRKQTTILHQLDPVEQMLRCEPGTVYVVSPKGYASWSQYYGVTNGALGSKEYRKLRYTFLPGIVTRGNLVARSVEVRQMEVARRSPFRFEEVQQNCTEIEREIVAVRPQ